MGWGMGMGRRYGEVKGAPVSGNGKEQGAVCRMPGQAPATRSAEHTTTCFLGGSRSRTSRARHRVFDVHDAGRQLIGQRCKYSKYSK